MATRPQRQGPLVAQTIEDRYWPALIAEFSSSGLALGPGQEELSSGLRVRRMS